MKTRTRVVAVLLVCVVFSAMLFRSAPAQTRRCGPMDIVFVVDDTGSMFGALDSIQTGLASIIDTATTASGGDLRLGLITFKDDVTVHNQLTTDLASVEAQINALAASGGNGAPEASDEAKHTAVNNLPAGARNDSAGFSGVQNGDFTVPYRSGAVKIVVLITDAPPGGFNDVSDTADRNAMHTHAVTAKSKGIFISDVFVPTAGDYDGQKALLEDDAATSGGTFTQVAADGSGTDTAINDIIATCGGARPGHPIPTLSEWALVAMALFLAFYGAGRARRIATTR